MLILTRKLQEKIFIGDHIVIQVIGVKGNQVKLGITAPKEVQILREEVVARFTVKNASCPSADLYVPQEFNLKFR